MERADSGVSYLGRLFVFLGVAQGPWTINEGLTRLALVRTVIGARGEHFLNLLLILDMAHRRCDRHDGVVCAVRRDSE
jgi:hypothetical protein